MSRFYETLKEASRLRPPDAKGDSAAGESSHAPADTNSRANDEHPSPVPAPTAAELVLPDVATLVEEPRHNGTGVAVHAVLDRRVRILPHAADSVVVEHYRRLRTKLLQEHETQPFRLLMVGSPNPQEGKTLTAFNLALSFAMLPSYRVLLVDGDLRKGSLGKWLSIEGPPGLSNLMEGTASLSDVILKADELPMHLVLRGNSKVSAGELLNSPHLRESFRQMAERYDLVVVDSPPLNLVTDAQLLAGCCDAILMVARAFSTTRKAFDRAVQDLHQSRIVGIILNGATRGPNRHYNHYY